MNFSSFESNKPNLGLTGNKQFNLPDQSVSPRIKSGKFVEESNKLSSNSEPKDRLATSQPINNLQVDQFAFIEEESTLTFPKTEQKTLPVTHDTSNEMAVSEQLKKDLIDLLQTLEAENPEQLKDLLEKIFGSQPTVKLDAVLSSIRLGSFPLPREVIFVDNGAISGANGAYASEKGGVIFLNKKLLSEPDKMLAVFIEETGHHLDYLLNGKHDSEGDEGQLFRLGLLNNGEISQQDLQIARKDNDHGFINFNGKTLAVEFDMGENPRLAETGSLKNRLKYNVFAKNYWTKLSKDFATGDAKAKGIIKALLEKTETELIDQYGNLELEGAPADLLEVYEKLIAKIKHLEDTINNEGVFIDGDLELEIDKLLDELEASANEITVFKEEIKNLRDISNLITARVGTLNEIYDDTNNPLESLPSLDVLKSLGSEIAQVFGKVPELYDRYKMLELKEELLGILRLKQIQYEASQTASPEIMNTIATLIKKVESYNPPEMQNISFGENVRSRVSEERNRFDSYMYNFGTEVKDMIKDLETQISLTFEPNPGNSPAALDTLRKTAENINEVLVVDGPQSRSSREYNLKLETLAVRLDNRYFNNRHKYDWANLYKVLKTEDVSITPITARAGIIQILKNELQDNLSQIKQQNPGSPTIKIYENLLKKIEQWQNNDFKAEFGEYGQWQRNFLLNDITKEIENSSELKEFEKKHLQDVLKHVDKVLDLNPYKNNNHDLYREFRPFEIALKNPPAGSKANVFTMVQDAFEKYGRTVNENQKTIREFKTTDKHDDYLSKASSEELVFAAANSEKVFYGDEIAIDIETLRVKVKEEVYKTTQTVLIPKINAYLQCVEQWAALAPDDLLEQLEKVADAAGIHVSELAKKVLGITDLEINRIWQDSSETIGVKHSDVWHRNLFGRLLHTKACERVQQSKEYLKEISDDDADNVYNALRHSEELRQMVYQEAGLNIPSSTFPPSSSYSDIKEMWNKGNGILTFRELGFYSAMNHIENKKSAGETMLDIINMAIALIPFAGPALSLGMVAGREIEEADYASEQNDRSGVRLGSGIDSEQTKDKLAAEAEKQNGAFNIVSNMLADVIPFEKVALKIIPVKKIIPAKYIQKYERLIKKLDEKTKGFLKKFMRENNLEKTRMALFDQLDPADMILLVLLAQKRGIDPDDFVKAIAKLTDKGSNLVDTVHTYISLGLKKEELMMRPGTSHVIEEMNNFLTKIEKGQIGININPQLRTHTGETAIGSYEDSIINIRNGNDFGTLMHEYKHHELAGKSRGLSGDKLNEKILEEEAEALKVEALTRLQNNETLADDMKAAVNAFLGVNGSSNKNAFLDLARQRGISPHVSLRYNRKHNAPYAGFDRHLTTGRPIHPESGFEINPRSGRQIHPESGFEINPLTNKEINPLTGRDMEFVEDLNAYRESGGDIVSLNPATGNVINPATGRDVNPLTGRDISVEGLDIKTGRMNSSTEVSINPTTGRDINPETGNDINPATGRDINPQTGNDLDPLSGNDIDLTSGKLLNREGQPLGRNQQYEIIRRHESLPEAIEAVLKEINGELGDNVEPSLVRAMNGRKNYEGMIQGYTSQNKDIIWRIDFEPDKGGIHINWKIENGAGRGAGAKWGAEYFPGSIQDYEHLLLLLNTADRPLKLQDLKL